MVCLPGTVRSQAKWVEKDSGDYLNLSVIRFQETNSVKNGRFEMYTGGLLVQKGFYSNNIRDSIWSYYCNAKIAAKRYFKNGEPVGKWVFYDSSGKVEILYDFDNGTYYVANRKNKQKTYKIIELNPVAHNHYPLFSDFELKCFLENNLIYPKKAIQKQDHGWVELELLVNKQGSVTGYRVLQSVSAEIDAEALKKVKLFPFHFIPAVADGKPKESSYILTVKFPQLLLQN
jgi:TonB family protein